MPAERVVNNGQTRLAADVSSSATAWTVVNASLVAPLLPGEVAHAICFTKRNPANAEIVKITAVSGNTLTVVRAAETLNGSQTAYAHPAGDLIAATLTVEALLNLIGGSAGALILAAVAAHEAAADPHPQYLTQSEGDARYGPGGGAPDAYYDHYQGVPADTWVVVHNLSKRPAVSVTDSSGRAVHGSVQYDNDQQVTVTFSAAFGGHAYLS